VELLYIWVENYAGLFKNQGFNFGGPFRFKFNANTLELNIKQDNHYISGFFNPEAPSNQTTAKITNVTAIVGQNGTGKSSLLDLLKGQLSTGEILQDTILVVRDINSKYAIYFPFGMDITVIGANEVPAFDYRPYKIKPDTAKNGQRYKVGRVSELQNLSYIFFSNIFDQRKEQTPKEVFNLSTNYLLSVIKDNSSYLEKNDLAIYRYREIERQLQLLNMQHYLNISLPFAKPETLTIDFTYEELDELPNTSDELSTLFNRIEKEASSPQEQLLATLINHLFVEILNLHCDHLITDKIKIYNITHGKSLIDRITNWLQTLSSKLTYNSSSKNNLQVLKRLITGIIELFRFLKEDIASNSGFKMEGTTLILDVTESDRFLSFYNMYSRSLVTHEFAMYDWRNLSSGEQAMLSMYARFYELIKHRNIKNENIMILIDEGELYFHPEWQKTLLMNLLRFFIELFNSEEQQYRIQILITSNSPFIVSDLPSSNVIFLRRLDGGCHVIDGLEEQKQTFASNIHTLLAHSFFMENGLIGEFAKSKINTIIDLLVHGKTNEINARKEFIEKTIHLIGEPIIKAKLISMLNDKLAVNFINIEGQIADLQRQIDELRGNLDDRN